MKKWLFNPFVFVAGTKSLLIGWLFILITAGIAFFSKTHFNGVIDLHPANHPASIGIHILEAAIDWVCITIILYLAGLIFSKSSIRLIDVAGTQSLARWPMIFAAIIGFGITMPPDLQKVPAGEVMKAVSGLSIIFSLISTVFTIWMVALMYNAFSISCNIRGGKAAGVFVGSLLLAEVISKVIFHFIH